MLGHLCRKELRPCPQPKSPEVSAINGVRVVSFSTSPSQSLSDRKPAEGLVPLTEIGVVRVRNLAIFWQDFIHVLRPGNLHTLG
jgi:hypothetical protein